MWFTFVRFMCVGLINIRESIPPIIPRLVAVIVRFLLWHWCSSMGFEVAYFT